MILLIRNDKRHSCRIASHDPFQLTTRGRRKASGKPPTWVPPDGLAERFHKRIIFMQTPAQIQATQTKQQKATTSNKMRSHQQIIAEFSQTQIQPTNAITILDLNTNCKLQKNKSPKSDCDRECRPLTQTHHTHNKRQIQYRECTTWRQNMHSH